MFSNDRNEMRKVFFTAWHKHLNQLPLEATETQLVAVILMHPEYHAMLDNPQNFQEENFGTENPFLHLGLHLAIRDQIATDRPAGIKKIYADLLVKHQEIIIAEHAMMSCLEEILWQAQQSGSMPDEKVYLEKLQEM
jgi:hypothetical protein